VRARNPAGAPKTSHPCKTLTAVAIAALVVAAILYDTPVLPVLNLRDAGT